MEIIRKFKHSISVLEARKNFVDAMGYINLLIRSEPTNNDKKILLDYVLNIIKRDLQAEFQAALIYEYGNLREINTPFPLFYYDENNISNSIVKEGVFSDTDLYKECVLALPWRESSVISTIKMLSKEMFQFSDTNHMSYFFEPVNICYVYNGIHSISAGVYYKKGMIRSKVCDITPLFSNVRTDGVYWYNLHTNVIIDSLFDFRIGLIFEVSKMIHKLLYE